MELPTVTVEPAEARRKINEYRNRKRRQADHEYQEILKAYEAVAKGLSLISLPDAFQAAGFDSDGLPKLAIARADRKRVRLTWQRWSLRLEFDCSDPNRWGSTESLLRTVRVEANANSMGHAGDKYQNAWNTQVPLVPPEIRDTANADLSKHYTLFEVKEWNVRAANPDPVLLRHVGGDIYAVLAVWELTDLEALVLSSL